MNREMFFGAYPNIFAAAKRLRKNMTVAEIALWEKLRNNKMGFRFKPQHPLLFYVADFYCHPLKLIIEVDGPIHEFQVEKDKERTRTIEEAGVRVIRFTNDQVINKMDYVLSEIKTVIEERKPY